jgi:hypothetical protein
MIINLINYKKKSDIYLIKFIESIQNESKCRIKFKDFRDAQENFYRKCGIKENHW